MYFICTEFVSKILRRIRVIDPKKKKKINRQDNIK